MIELLKHRGSDVELCERMAHYGIVGSETWRLAAIAPSAGEDNSPDDKTLRCLANEGVGMANAYLESLDAHFLAAWYQGCLCVLLALRPEQERETSRELVAGLVRHASSELGLQGLRAGVSGPSSGACGGVEALRQAREGLLMQGRLSHGCPVVLHEELALHIALLDSLPDECLHRLHVRIVQPLLDADKRSRAGGHLYETLLTFLEQDRSLERTAQALYLHRNSLASRLQHIEHLIGVNLHSTDGLVDVRLALQGETLLHLRDSE